VSFMPIGIKLTHDPGGAGMYLDEDAELIRSLLPAGARPPAGAHELFRLYALLMRAKGERVTLVDVHDAWSIWQARDDPAHPSLRPFAELDEPTQRADAPYAQAIREAARVTAQPQPQAPPQQPPPPPTGAGVRD
jgi:hypothetical protein